MLVVITIRYSYGPFCKDFTMVVFTCAMPSHQNMYGAGSGTDFYTMVVFLGYSNTFAQKTNSVESEYSLIEQLRPFADTIYLQATYSTKIYIDFDIPQTSALINLPKKSSSKRQLLKEEKTVEHILTLPGETSQPFRATCLATFSKVYIVAGFNYDACTTCNAGVNKDLDNYWCCNCKKKLGPTNCKIQNQIPG